MKRLLAVLILTLMVNTTYAHGTGRYCSNAYCMMCNRLHLKHGHDITTTGLSYTRYLQLHKDAHMQAHMQAHKDITIDSTPQVVVDSMLAAVNPTEDDVLYDLGCGDGRILITAVKKYNCVAVGIELNPNVAAIAKANIKKAGLEHRIQIVTGDARKYELSDATIVTMYLFPDLMLELEPHITHATRIVSYSHEIPNRNNSKILVQGKYPVYVWAKQKGFL